MRHSIKLAFLFLLTAMSQAAVIYNQPPSSTSFPSAVNTVDNPTYQDRLRDRFRFTTATTIREIRWRGSFDESAPIGFTVKIFDFTVGSAAQLNFSEGIRAKPRCRQGLNQSGSFSWVV